MDWDLPAYVVIWLLGIAIAGSGVRAYLRNGEGIMLLVAVGIFSISSYGIVEWLVKNLLLYGDELADFVDVFFVGFGESSSHVRPA